MINVSTAWMQALYNDQRDYQVHIKLTLKDNTVLNLTNENIWGGSLGIDDAVSSESDFQIGAAIINKMNVTINNIYGDYDAYDFYGARVEVKIGLIINGTEERIDKGRYIVNNATYNGQLIALECYDYMYFFDVPYSNSGQTFPATIDNIVRNCCTDIGVPLNTYNFPHKAYSIAFSPDKTKTTYREIISWCAQICGCFARCNNVGQLEFKWYPLEDLDRATISDLDGGIFDEDKPYSTGDTADGGSFNPWNLGDVYDGGAFNWNLPIHKITSLYNLNVSVDDVVITRIQAIVKAEDTQNSAESEKTYSVGTEGYTVQISGNQFITESNANEILTWLGNELIGAKFRKANISHASDPSIEAGDAALVYDRKNTLYPILISSTRFSTGGAQTSISAAQTPLRNSAARFSAETKNYVDLRQRLKNERTTREQTEAQLAQDIANSNGMYKTETTEGGATKYYLHNKPRLQDSAIRILFSDVGITVTANGLDPNPSWYGLRVNGDLISRILSATGINADWINTGELTSQDANQNFSLNLNTGVLTMKNGSINIGNNFIVNTDGSATLKKLTVTGSPSINGYATTTSVNTALSNYDTTATVNSKLSNYDTTTVVNSKLSNYPTKANLKNGDGSVEIDGSIIQAQTVGVTQIADGAINTDKLAANAITAAKIAANTITTAQLAASVLNANNITAGTLKSQGTTPNFSLDLTNGTVSIKSGSINLGNGNFYVDTNGSAILKNVTIQGSPNISGYATTNDLGNYATTSGLAAGTTVIDAGCISTGTISANVLNLSGYLTATDVGSNGSTTISGSRVTTGTIQSSNKNVVFDVTNGTLTIKSGSINLGNGNFYVDTYGNATLKSVTIQGSPSISGYATTDAISDFATKTNLSNGVTKIDGGCIQSGKIDAQYLNISGFLTATDVGSNGSTTISGSRVTTGTIQSDNRNVVFDVDNGTLTIKSGSINLGNGNFYVDTYGNATLKSVTIQGSPSISGYATTGDIANFVTSSTLSSYAKKTGLSNGTTTISGDCITTGTIKNSSETVVFDVSQGSLKMNKGSINIGSGKFVVDTDGNLTSTSSIVISNKYNYYTVKIENGDVSFLYKNGTFCYIDSEYATATGATNTLHICVNKGRNSNIFLDAGGYGAISINATEGTYISTALEVNKKLTVNTDCEIKGNLTVKGSNKNRLIETKDYGNRLMNAYETTSSLFGDVGHGIISDDGFCNIYIDPVFNQTITTVNDYYIFIQKCGEGECYVFDKKFDHFTIKGTPNLKFDWEIKCKQIGNDNCRLQYYDYKFSDYENKINYSCESNDHIKSLKKERNLTK